MLRSAQRISRRLSIGVVFFFHLQTTLAERFLRRSKSKTRLLHRILRIPTNPLELFSPRPKSPLIARAHTILLLVNHVKGITKFRGGPISSAGYVEEALTNPKAGFYIKRLFEA